ncbi:MAG TPA: hypothetical protein PKD54_08475 [Pirellulaceae bacterium]|nr:hypothetical protein [Pirellulaceae bacterium]
MKHKQNSNLVKCAFGTLAVCLGSAVWLFLAWSAGNRTKTWTPTLADIEFNDVVTTRRGQPAGWRTTITYTVDGQGFKAVVDEYLIGKEATVFVNPDDPRQVVGKTGARIQDMGYPLIITIGSGLFAIALLLIAFSPKDD